MKPHLLMLAGLLLVTALVFAPVVGNGFVAWDDQQEIYLNPDFNPVSWRQISHTWKEPAESVWMPLTYYAWGAIAAIAPRTREGMLEAWPFHAASLVCHLVAVAFVSVILRRLVNRDWPALLGAAIFALHPLQVESVAWASEMTTVLSGALSFAALHQYLQSLDASGRSRWIRIATATLLYAAALLTKPTAMIMPVAIVVIHVVLHRKDWKILAATLGAWIPLAVADLLIALRYQPASHIASLPIHQRLMVAGDAIAFYLRKILLPIGIIPDYGRSPQAVIVQHSFWGIASIVFVIAAIVMLRKAPRFSAGAALFLLGIGPLLGLVKFDYQFYSTVADRYVYLGMFGIALMLAALLNNWRHRAAIAAGIAIVIAISVLSLLQTPRWHDTRRLFEYTLTVRPDSFAAHKVLGLELSNSDPEAAAQHFQAAIMQRPQDATTHYNFGELLARQGKVGEAAREFQTTIDLNPTHAKALDSLGIAMWRTKRLDEAQQFFERAIDASKQNGHESADAHEHLALLLYANGDAERAIQHLQTALQINPNLTTARRELNALTRGR